MSDRRPILWHIPVSHYSEKARWALAHKGIEHDRRAPLPGVHMAISLWLTRGAHKTLPVLRLNGRSVGDSTAIIAALEDYRPEAPLYPDDPDERRRALELEEFFDEELGPHLRLLVWHEVRPDADRMSQVSSPMLPDVLRGNRVAEGVGLRVGTTFVQLRYRVASNDAAANAREKVNAAFDRLDAELDRCGYLAGGAFSVADLTAAALFYPLVLPPEAPRVLADDPPPAFEDFRAPFKERPGFAWVERMFREHRRP